MSISLTIRLQRFTLPFWAGACLPVLASAPALARVYNVGPGSAAKAIGDVPWETLQAGDTVTIHWRPEPYREKWVICRRGTAAEPIVVRGVAGPEGQLPIIDGQGATTRRALHYWNERRGIIKIGGASVPADTMPAHITIENLEIRGARPPYAFTSSRGETQTYSGNAAALYIEKGAKITIRNCILNDSGNGLLVGSNDREATSDVLVERCHLYGNGIEGSLYEHNNYTAARGIVFQYNRFGPLRAGCPGNNLKDRSSGLVVRYNWIEGGNRQLDLVDGADSVQIRSDPRYRETFVYGNILIEPDSDGNRQIVHYGGDGNGTSIFRKGTLYFYNNTVVSLRTDRTTLLRLSTGDERCDFRNNITYTTAPGRTLEMLASDGTVSLSHNWFRSGWVRSFFPANGQVKNDGTSLTGEAPGFIDAANGDYRLSAGSPCIDTGTALAPSAPEDRVRRQYVRHRSAEDRPAVGPLDIGAFEYDSESRSTSDMRRNPRPAR